MSTPPFLLSPGPVTIPDFVLEALHRPVIHHRTKAFESFYETLCRRLQYLFQTESLTGTFPGSGTYGVEMAMRSLFRSGEQVLILNNGKFSERWVQYGQLLGLQVLELKVAWGKRIDVEQVQHIAQEYPTLTGVVLTHSETSTGAVIDLEEMADALRRAHPEICILVDAITSVGSLPYYHDEWGIDASIVASQKALLNPAGLVAFALSTRAEARLSPTFGGDFANLHNFAAQARLNSYPFTPPLTLLYGVNAALQRMEDETLPVWWQRSQDSARTFREGLAQLGGQVFTDHPGHSLTAFTIPEVDLTELQQHVENTHGLVLAGGQGRLHGNILRVSHMGGADVARMKQLLAGIQAYLVGRVRSS